MTNEELLFKLNSSNVLPKRVPIVNRKITYSFKNREIGLSEVKKSLLYFSAIEKKYKSVFLPFELNCGVCSFEDKLTYVLFECFFLYVITNFSIKCSFNFNCKHNIFNEGIKYSFLKTLNQNNDEINKKFNLEISTYHFRRVIDIKTYDETVISKVMQDVDSFLKFYSISKEYRDSVSEVIGELVDNALYHGRSDCLIDLDVTNNYVKRVQNDGSKYYGVNIVVLGFSKVLLGEKLLEKMKKASVDSLNDKYAQLMSVYEIHKDNFNEIYNEKSFYMVASFQHKISSRDSVTGGTGLTCLIRALEEKSDAYNCYVLSGDKKINFIKEFLQHDQNEWMGFNKENNYFSSIPDKHIIEKSPIYFPGTVYNLNFVLRRED